MTTNRAHILLWTDQPKTYLDAIQAAGLAERVAVDTLPRKEKPSSDQLARTEALMAGAVPAGLLPTMPKLRWAPHMLSSTARSPPSPALTPAGLQTGLPAEAGGTGFLSRTILVYGEPSNQKITFRKVATDAENAEYLEFFQRLGELKGEMFYTTEGADLLDLYAGSGAIGLAPFPHLMTDDTSPFAPYVKLRMRPFGSA